MNERCDSTSEITEVEGGFFLLAIEQTFDTWEVLVFLGSEKAERGMVGSIG